MLPSARLRHCAARLTSPRLAIRQPKLAQDTQRKNRPKKPPSGITGLQGLMDQPPERPRTPSPASSPSAKAAYRIAHVRVVSPPAQLGHCAPRLTSPRLAVRQPSQRTKGKRGIWPTNKGKPTKENQQKKTQRKNRGEDRREVKSQMGRNRFAGEVSR